MNKMLYQEHRNAFFDQNVQELEAHFQPHKQAARETGIRIHQMHMPYPIYVPGAPQELNDYLWKVVAPKSLQVCHFFACKYIVVHGVKLVRYCGSEEGEWTKTREFLESLAPMAKELGVTMCLENLYIGRGARYVEGPCCNAVKAARRIDEMFPEELKEAALTLIMRVGEYFKYDI